MMTVVSRAVNRGWRFAADVVADAAALLDALAAAVYS